MFMEMNKYLKHYNHNHDALGRFTSSRSSSITYTSRNAKKANQVYNTMTNKEKYYLTGGDKRDWYVRQKEYTGKNKSAVYSLITQNENVPVSFLDIFSNGDGTAEVAIGVSKNSRGKGYAQESMKRGMEWFDNNPEVQQLVWGVNANNKASIELAKKYGFKRDRNYDYDKEWIAYSRKKR